MLDKPRLISRIEQLCNARVLVLGDVMLDCFVQGAVTRISPEAPVAVLRACESKSCLGGAGNVVRNLISLGAAVSFISLIGNDREGEEIGNALSKFEKIKYDLVVEQERKTTVKTRFIAERQQVLRVDSETTDAVKRESRDMVLKLFHSYSESCDVVVLSDYGKGLLCKDIMSEVIEVSRSRNIPVLIDPKGTDYERYRGASILTPNLKELKEATELPVENDNEVITAAEALIETCALAAVLVTRSHEGMSLIQKAGNFRHLRAEAREVFDVTGAGDTVIAVMAAAIGSGAPLEEAAILANVAGGIVVGKIGTAVVHPRDLLKALHRQELSSAEEKVVDVEGAVERVEQWRRKGHRIGMTTGVYDFLQAGHVALLSQVSLRCDRLIVGLHSDDSVRRLTSEEPLQHEGARSAIVASLEAVDLVVIFSENTPVRLLALLRPDVLIKGENDHTEDVIGANIVKSYGGAVSVAKLQNSAVTNSDNMRAANKMF